MNLKMLAVAAALVLAPAAAFAACCCKEACPCCPKVEQAAKAHAH